MSKKPEDHESIARYPNSFQVEVKTDLSATLSTILYSAYLKRILVIRGVFSIEDDEFFF
jgi:hypothetical protein